jgi:phosphatidylserine/phosphatidylglycerophosphate/cardiolipin synthase-like enzyme
MLQPYFTQHDQIVCDFIRKAQRSLQIAICWFTHPGIFNVLKQRCRDGLHIEIILNYDQVNFHPEGLDFIGLEKVGARVYGYAKPDLMHHKFAIVDEQKLLMGSYNWTRGKHFDAVLISENKHAVQEFSLAFKTLMQHCTPFSTLRSSKTPKNSSFTQLFQPLIWSPAELRQRIVAGANVWVTMMDDVIWPQCLKQQRHYLRGGGQDYWQQQSAWDAQAFANWNARQSGAARARLHRYCTAVKYADLIVAVHQKQGNILGYGLIASEPQESEVPGYGFSRFVQWKIPAKKMPAPDQHLLKTKSVFYKYRGSGLQLADALHALNAPCSETYW